LVEVTVLGAINWDINLFVERFPEIGEEVPVEKITRVPGGKAANVAVAVTRILGAGCAAVIGCLGKDEIAEIQLKVFEEEGVVTSGITLLEGEESGQAYIIIDENGRNVINTFFGANQKLLPDVLNNPKIMNLLKESKVITVVDSPIETIREVVTVGKEEEKAVVWDAGVRSTLGINRLKEILEKIDFLVINEVEVKNLTGVDDPIDAFSILYKVNENISLVAKLGNRGCVMVNSEEAVRCGIINLAKLGLKVVNTVGCGDAFLGAFIASKAKGFSNKEALERANLAGALKATKPETRGSPFEDELNKYLEFIERGETIKRFRG